MCMITYIPINESNFMLAHSRDENILRPIATPPIKREINGIQHMFPVDPQGRGTWIGFSEKGNVAALFNGGTERYTPDPPYKFSRGLIVPKYFKYSGFQEFYDDFKTNGFEPFTMLVFEKGRIYMLQKDVDKVTMSELNPLKPHLFLSANLYPAETKENRRLELLNLYFEKGFLSQQDILGFHDKYRFEKNTDDHYDTGEYILHTVSTSFITKTPKNIEIDYFDKVNDIKINNKLKVTKSENLEIYRLRDEQSK